MLKERAVEQIYKRVGQQRDMCSSILVFTKLVELYSSAASS